MILVTGATGTVGTALAHELRLRSTPFRALVRNPEKAKAIAGSGVELATGDLERPETLGPALRGVDRVFLLSGPDPRVVALHGNLIDAAKTAGVKHVVRLSAFGSEPGTPARLLQWHAQADQRLAQSGLGWTVLRPHYFMQNTLWFAGTIAAQGALYAPMDAGRIGMIDVRDIAAAAAEVLAAPETHAGKTLLLTGSESLSMEDVAARIGAAIGRNVAFVNVPPEATRQAMLGMGMQAWLADGLLELFALWSTTAHSDVTGTLEAVIRRKPRTFDAFASEFAAVFAGKAGVGAS